MEDYFELSEPNRFSSWECEFLGTVYRPAVGKVPCWFHRKLQTLLLGVKWRKIG